MKTELLHILQHSLGLDEYGRGQQYRNHFVAGGKDVDKCEELTALGMMTKHKPSELSGACPCFHVTAIGISAVATESPAAPKISRARFDRQTSHTMSYFSKTVGHCWARPDFTSETEGKPYAEYIAVSTNHGILLWTAIDQIMDGPRAGEIVWNAVRASTIGRVALTAKQGQSSERGQS